MGYIRRGLRELQFGKKWQESSKTFRLYPELEQCIRSVKTDIAQILSLGKDVKLLGNHSYPHARLLPALLLRN